jgi:hypothetical protein
MSGDEEAEGRQGRSETRRRALPDIGVAVHEVAGRAMAAVLLDKSEEAVTPDEAWAALESHAARPGDPSARSAAAVLLGKAPDTVTQEETDGLWRDRDRTYRAIRAAWRAIAMMLEPETVPASLAGELVPAFRGLDEGEVIGLAMPAKRVLHGGKPAQYGPPARRKIGRWMVMETAFQTGLRNPLSFDAAVGLVTGVTRNGHPSPHGPPLLPLGRAWDAVWSFIRRNEGTLGCGTPRKRKARPSPRDKLSTLNLRRHARRCWR